jgi:hypothetical protein
LFTGNAATNALALLAVQQVAECVAACIACPLLLCCCVISLAGPPLLWPTAQSLPTSQLQTSTQGHWLLLVEQPQPGQMLPML